MRRKLTAAAFALLLLSSQLFGAFTVINRTSKWCPQCGSSYSYGGPFEVYWQPVPMVLTSLANNNNDIRLIAITLYNSNVASVTITFQTKDSSPYPLPLSGPIASGTSVSFNMPAGLLCHNGASIQASDAGVYFSGQWTN
jgi:hypothetical protein